MKFLSLIVIREIQIRILCVLACAPLAGCVGDSIFSKHHAQDSANSAANGGMGAGIAPAESPYALHAYASGQVIDLELTNGSASDLAISPAYFALIPHGTRHVINYDAQSATIEISSVAHPGETVKGRAVFREYGSPAGNRLVFNPGNNPVFAVIGDMGMGGSTRSSRGGSNAKPH